MHTEERDNAIRQRFPITPVNDLTALALELGFSSLRGLQRRAHQLGVYRTSFLDRWTPEQMQALKAEIARRWGTEPIL